MSSTSTQRRKLKVMGGIHAAASLPTTALPAHISGGTSSSRAVRRFKGA